MHGFGEPVRYRLRQSFRYDYDGPVTDLVHRLVVVPPTRRGDQRLLRGAVEVSDPAATLTWSDDVEGNRHCVVRLSHLDRSLELLVNVVVERSGAARPLAAEALRDTRYRRPTDVTRPDGALLALAAEHRGGDPLEVADRLCAAVHERIAYVPGATTVRTTAAQALALGAGVCQDQAHVMLSALRAAGVPSRYVSGHLVGQGGTHAWVEVLVAEGRGARVVAYDPCHARRTDRRYVTVAVGRDYRDVPPTSGWFRGDARGTLACERTLRSSATA